MSNTTQRFVTTAQTGEMLLARGPQAVRIRVGLIALLAGQTKISNLSELSTGKLVGQMLVLEKATEPLGDVIQSIIAPTPIEEPKTHKTARRIMGDNFLGLPEVAQAFGLVSQALQDVLATIPFNRATLRRHRKTHMLVADIGLSIIDLRRRMKRGLFHSSDNAWYNTQEFAKRTEGVAWRLIRKTPVPNSVSKNWDEQKVLLGEYDAVPTARQVIYAIMLTFVTTGERLFEQIYVRTIDVDSNGMRVDVGGFGSAGLMVNDWDGHDRSVSVGVSSSRMAA